MQYKVPQNIDQEDKILGPFTFVQFIYILMGGAVVILLFATFPFIFALLLAVPAIIVTLSFSLIKIQDQPFSRFVTAFIVFAMQPKRRIWHDLESERSAQPGNQEAKEQVKSATQPADKPAPQKIDIAKTVPVSQVNPTPPATTTQAPQKPARIVPINVGGTQ